MGNVSIGRWGCNPTYNYGAPLCIIGNIYTRYSSAPPVEKRKWPAKNRRMLPPSRLLSHRHLAKHGYSAKSHTPEELYVLSSWLSHYLVLLRQDRVCLYLFWILKEFLTAAFFFQWMWKKILMAIRFFLPKAKMQWSLLQHNFTCFVWGLILSAGKRFII